MHSPIIYLIEQGTEFAEEVGHELPSEFHQDEIQLCDLIDEADYAKENVLNESKMENFEIENDIYKWLKDKQYFNVDRSMNLKISHYHITNWDKELLNVFEYFTHKIRQNIGKISNQEYDLNKEIELDEKLGNEYGGIRFLVVHKDVDTDEDSIESGEIMNTRDLINYARYQMEKENINHVVHFKICTNVLGDYHH